MPNDTPVPFDSEAVESAIQNTSETGKRILRLMFLDVNPADLLTRGDALAMSGNEHALGGTLLGYSNEADSLEAYRALGGQYHPDAIRYMLVLRNDGRARLSYPDLYVKYVPPVAS